MLIIFVPIYSLGTVELQFNKNARKTQDIRGFGLSCTGTNTDDRCVNESTIKHHVHLSVYIGNSTGAMAPLLIKNHGGKLQYTDWHHGFDNF